MAGRQSFRLEGDLISSLESMHTRNKRAMVAGMKYIEPQAQAHMKTNAPWTDRTGAARNGLSAQTIVSKNTVALVLYHTVDYGPYLEVRWGGRYAIIRPTIEWAIPLVIESIGRLLFKP